MKTFLLFVFGVFDDQEDIEYFCSEVLSESKAIKSVRFVIENTGNIIIIFDSDYDYKSLSQDLFPIMVSDNIKFYFIFDREMVCPRQSCLYPSTYQLFSQQLHYSSGLIKKPFFLTLKGVGAAAGSWKPKATVVSKATE